VQQIDWEQKTFTVPTDGLVTDISVLDTEIFLPNKN
jgi:hypothetical protein